MSDDVRTGVQAQRQSQTSATAVSNAPRRNHVGNVSLLAALAGAVGCRVALTQGPYAGALWLQVVAAGFEAAVIGGLADWFAVTALFRHPLGLPIPHTAIIPARRAKIVESIVSMVQDVWLAPDVIASRLTRVAPSAIVIDWLSAPEHSRRIGAPVRDVLTGLARLVTEPEVIEFVEHTLQRQLREAPIDPSMGRWLTRLVASERAAAAFQSAALSLANLARQPQTGDTLQAWIDHSARQLHRDGRRLVPLLLRRKVVQRKIVEAVCEYGATELMSASTDPEHRLRQYVFDAVRRFADRLAGGESDALKQVEQVRVAVTESLEAKPLILDMLASVRAQLERDLGDPTSHLSELIERQLRAGIVDLLDDAGLRTRFDRWVRTTAEDLLRRHHHQIGLTVRENLEALDTGALVAQIEDRVGADLQFIRLNGAVVGGAIGVLVALIHPLIRSG
jgi:uncharacterized membrane-anchored protein YjiN (DUF445 family)